MYCLMFIDCHRLRISASEFFIDLFIERREREREIWKARERERENERESRMDGFFGKKINFVKPQLQQRDFSLNIK